MPFSPRPPWRCADPLLEQTFWDDEWQWCQVTMLEECCQELLQPNGCGQEAPGTRKELFISLRSSTLRGNPTLQRGVSPQWDSAPSSPAKGLGFYAAIRHWMALLHWWHGAGKMPGIKCAKASPAKSAFLCRLWSLSSHSGLPVLGCCKEHV